MTNGAQSLDTVMKINTTVIEANSSQIDSKYCFSSVNDCLWKCLHNNPFEKCRRGRGWCVMLRKHCVRVLCSCWGLLGETGDILAYSEWDVNQVFLDSVCEDCTGLNLLPHTHNASAQGKMCFSIAGFDVRAYRKKEKKKPQNENLMTSGRRHMQTFEDAVRVNLPVC